MVEETEEEVAAVVLWSNTRLNVEVAKPQIFDREADKILGFLMVYFLFLLSIFFNLISVRATGWKSIVLKFSYDSHETFTL